MFYFVLIVSLILFFLLGYKQKKLFLSLTQGEFFVSAERSGTIRSYVYALSVILSLLISVINVITGLLSDVYSLGYPLFPISITYVYYDAYGASAAIKVFLILFFEIIMMSVLCFLRGLSFKMILAYIKDGKCTQYKYVKKITRVLVFAFLVQILVLLLAAIESDLAFQLTGEHYDTYSPNSFVIYNLIWINAFFILSYEYKNKIKMFSPVFSADTHEQDKDKQNSTLNNSTLNVEYAEETRKTVNPEIEIKNDSIHIENQSNTDEVRLAELSEELKKIPVAKVKQWHNEGKITDEQYKTVARKYNEIRKEMKEIKERAELAKQIEIEENNVKSEKNKTNHSKFKTLIICFSFIAAITGTSFLSVHLANISRIYSDEDYQKLQEKYTTLEINYNNQKRLLNTVSNNYKKLNENYLALLAENEKNDSQSVDSVESYLNNEIEEQTTNTIKTTSPIRTYVMSKIYGTDAYPGSFTIGSTKDEVKEAMGIAPDKIINYDYSGDVWYYYDSKITFDTSDRVNGWDIGETLLPVY